MSLKGYWPLNEKSGTTVYDHTGNENHGTLNGGVSQTNSGILGQYASDFDGTDGNIRHDYTTSKSFTVNLWMRSDQSAWSATGAGWSDRSASGFILHPEADSRGWDGYILADSFNDYYQIGTHTVSDISNWHMYTITHDNNSDTSKMYLDGREVVSASTTTNRAVNQNTATLGHDDLDSFTEGERPLDGKISEARIYGRVLTTSELDYLYQVGKRGRQVTTRKTS